jgi:hypothetical protein
LSQAIIYTQCIAKLIVSPNLISDYLSNAIPHLISLVILVLQTISPNLKVLVYPT